MEETEPLKGGYGIPYDPRPALEKLSTSHDEAIAELWENLYHQGDVGLASYAAVPARVQAGELSLVAAIEVARHSESNPRIPDRMSMEYEKALQDALASSPSEEQQLVGYYIIHASVHDHPRLARALDLMSIDEILSEYG